MKRKNLIEIILMYLALASPFLSIAGTNSGGGGYIYEINLTEARVVATQILATVSMSKFLKTRISEKAKKIFQKDSGCFLDKMKDPDLTVKILSPSLRKEKPIKAKRSGKLIRVEAYASPTTNEILIDYDLTYKFDRIRLSKLFIHEAGHLCGHGSDDETEMVLNEIAVATLQSSSVDQQKVIQEERKTSDIDLSGEKIADAYNLRSTNDKIKFVGFFAVGAEKRSYDKCLSRALKPGADGYEHFVAFVKEVKKGGFSSYEKYCEQINAKIDLKGKHQDKTSLVFERDMQSSDEDVNEFWQDNYLVCDRPDVCRNPIVCDDDRRGTVRMMCHNVPKHESYLGTGDHVSIELDKADLITGVQRVYSVGGMKRVSKAGAEFNRDVSQPALGEAYRDPSGLIWGNIINRMNQYDADKYCKAVGARLPTKSEFEQLAKYLGYRTSGGYNPYLADGRSDVLPGLSQYVFWSSSEGNNSPVQFEGQDGSDRGARLEELASVRCVQNSNKTSNSKN